MMMKDNSKQTKILLMENIKDRRRHKLGTKRFYKHHMRNGMLQARA